MIEKSVYLSIIERDVVWFFLVVFIKALNASLNYVPNANHSAIKIC